MALSSASFEFNFVVHVAINLVLRWQMVRMQCYLTNIELSYIYPLPQVYIGYCYGYQPETKEN